MIRVAQETSSNLPTRPDVVGPRIGGAGFLSMLATANDGQKYPGAARLTGGPSEMRDAGSGDSDTPRPVAKTSDDIAGTDVGDMSAANDARNPAALPTPKEIGPDIDLSASEQSPPGDTVLQDFLTVQTRSSDKAPADRTVIPVVWPAAAATQTDTPAVRPAQAVLRSGPLSGSHAPSMTDVQPGRDHAAHVEARAGNRNPAARPLTASTAPQIAAIASGHDVPQAGTGAQDRDSDLVPKDLRGIGPEFVADRMPGIAPANPTVGHSAAAARQVAALHMSPPTQNPENARFDTFGIGGATDNGGPGSERPPGAETVRSTIPPMGLSLPDMRPGGTASIHTPLVKDDGQGTLQPSKIDASVVRHRLSAETVVQTGAPVVANNGTTADPSVQPGLPLGTPDATPQTALSETAVLRVATSPETGSLRTPLQHQPPMAQQIARTVEVFRGTAGGAVELSLAPDELGSVRITLQRSDTGYHIAIVAERDETLAMLRRNVDQLDTAFRDLDLGQTDISFGREDRGDRPAFPEDASVPASTGDGFESATTLTSARLVMAAGRRLDLML